MRRQGGPEQDGEQCIYWVGRLQGNQVSQASEVAKEVVCELCSRAFRSGRKSDKKRRKCVTERQKPGAGCFVPAVSSRVHFVASHLIVWTLRCQPFRRVDTSSPAVSSRGTLCWLPFRSGDASSLEHEEDVEFA